MLNDTVFNTIQFYRGVAMSLNKQVRTFRWTALPSKCRKYSVNTKEDLNLQQQRCENLASHALFGNIRSVSLLYDPSARRTKMRETKIVFLKTNL